MIITYNKSERDKAVRGLDALRLLIRRQRKKRILGIYKICIVNRFCPYRLASALIPIYFDFEIFNFLFDRHACTSRRKSAGLAKKGGAANPARSFGLLRGDQTDKLSLRGEEIETLEPVRSSHTIKVSVILL